MTRFCPLSPEPVFWFYVKEVLNKHELQRFYSLHHITADVGRGRAWLRCALNEHSLERYLHMLLADRTRLRYPAGQPWAWWKNLEAGLFPCLPTGGEGDCPTAALLAIPLVGEPVPQCVEGALSGTHITSSVNAHGDQGLATVLGHSLPLHPPTFNLGFFSQSQTDQRDGNCICYFVYFETRSHM